MKLAFLFAWRYIFSKKSTNAINIIAMVSVSGIALGSMALLIIMSVFNGFEDVLRDLISKFKPDIQITIAEGKTFSLDSHLYNKIKQLPNVKSAAQTLEEVALFAYDGTQILARLKGVDDNFAQVIDFDTIITNGEYKIYDTEQETHFAIVGITLETTLGVSPFRADNRPLVTYMPKREGKNLSGTKPFRQRNLYPAAIYTVKQADYDNFVITNLAFVQELLAYENHEVSAIEIKAAPNTDLAVLKMEIQNIIGNQFLIKDRYEQDEAFFKVTNLEKWVGFIIFSFTLLLVAFNMVGALWMLVLEKKKDITILKALGADNQLIRRIFLLEGALLSTLGVFIGVILAVVICVLQQQFNFVKLDNGSGAFIIDAYPVSMRFSDFLLVIFTVFVIGTIAAWLPALRAANVQNIVNND
jgi:lipoprotein-releasing system permease protein